MIANDILKAFNAKYPKLKATAIFELDDRYVVEAPRVTEGIDYADPYYQIDFSLTKVSPFMMKDIKKLFIAFSKGPIWKAK